MVAIFENIILRNAMWNTKQPVENILHGAKEFLCGVQWNLVKCLKKAAEGIISLKCKVGELCGGVSFCFPSCLLCPVQIAVLKSWLCSCAMFLKLS